jgi:hypothetical protein
MNSRRNGVVNTMERWDHAEKGKGTAVHYFLAVY